MLAFWVSPTIGRAVSSGVLATKDLDAPNGTGLLSAKKGVRPVAVGPILYQRNILPVLLLGPRNTGV